jgi:hypothetical protein
MYASVNADDLKTYTSDCLNISELQKMRIIYENELYRILR